MMKTTVILPILASLISANAQSSGPIVNTSSASFQGTFDTTTNVTNFFGIRYASPPIGDLRFRAPQPPPAISGVQQADTRPPECFQASRGLNPVNPFVNGTVEKRQTVQQTEDCLFLNVHIPGSSVSKQPLPVVVWIHGGGYVGGSASVFPGSDLIHEADSGVIAVTIQYRLGVFGFLSGQKVKDDGALNAGLPFRWVHEHISSFGGDNEKITIWGESAGAGSVLQHVIAQNGQTRPQLFRAAMTSSTFLPSQYNFNDRIPEAVFGEVVAMTNCSSAQDTLSCLRAVDANTLEAANTNISMNGFFGTFLFVPVVDGSFITQRATEALRQRKVNGQALLSVTNTNEGVSFVNQTNLGVEAATYAVTLFPNFGAVQEQEVARIYAGLGSPLNQANRIMGESIFICPTYFLLNAFAGNGFKGEFALPPATHGMDVAYYFPNNARPSFQNPDFLKAFSGVFMDFVISLDPNVKVDPTNITPRWSKFNVGNTEMVFNRTEDSTAAVIHTTTTDPKLLERCNFWDSVGALTGQ
ncbi:hypothetical protein D9758_008541 [Tetrapyrgos nigripes]|uniref:Carboxylic ester hydrolase n=1 Tax=Tetrapyrgos nigripes TaxID=182062 RepID=A0A8H5G5L2_9AGAR|nr:hypothetical protein D9758_008541 [Tetrapyrgos nigripes]